MGVVVVCFTGNCREESRLVLGYTVITIVVTIVHSL